MCVGHKLNIDYLLFMGSRKAMKRKKRRKKTHTSNYWRTFQGGCYKNRRDGNLNIKESLRLF